MRSGGRVKEPASAAAAARKSSRSAERTVPQRVAWLVVAGGTPGEDLLLPDRVRLEGGEGLGAEVVSAQAADDVQPDRADGCSRTGGRRRAAARAWYRTRARAGSCRASRMASRRPRSSIAGWVHGWERAARNAAAKRWAASSLRPDAVLDGEERGPPRPGAPAAGSRRMPEPPRRAPWPCIRRPAGGRDGERRLFGLGEPACARPEEVAPGPGLTGADALGGGRIDAGLRRRDLAPPEGTPHRTELLDPGPVERPPERRAVLAARRGQRGQVLRPEQPLAPQVAGETELQDRLVVGVEPGSSRSRHGPGEGGRRRDSRRRSPRPPRRPRPARARSGRAPAPRRPGRVRRRGTSGSALATSSRSPAWISQVSTEGNTDAQGGVDRAHDLRVHLVGLQPLQEEPAGPQPLPRPPGRTRG